MQPCSGDDVSDQMCHRADDRGARQVRQCCCCGAHTRISAALPEAGDDRADDRVRAGGVSPQVDVPAPPASSRSRCCRPRARPESPRRRRRAPCALEPKRRAASAPITARPRTACESGSIDSVQCVSRSILVGPVLCLPVGIELIPVVRAGRGRAPRAGPRSAAWRREWPRRAADRARRRSARPAGR